MPGDGEYLSAENYFDQAISNSVDEPTLVTKNQDINLNKFNLTNINSITLITQAVHKNEVFTKSHLDQFHQKNEYSRRDSGIDFYNISSDIVKINQDKSSNDNNLTNLDSVTVNRKPSSENELANK